MQTIKHLQQFYSIERRLPNEAWVFGLHVYQANGYTEIALSCGWWALLVSIPKVQKVHPVAR